MTGGPGITPWERLQRCWRTLPFDELAPGAIIALGPRLLEVKELARSIEGYPTHLNALDCDTTRRLRDRRGYVQEADVVIRAVDLLQDYPAIAKRWTVIRRSPLADLPVTAA